MIKILSDILLLVLSSIVFIVVGALTGLIALLYWNIDLMALPLEAYFEEINNHFTIIFQKDKDEK